MSDVTALGVALPDFDNDVPHRLAAGGENATGEMRYLADGGRNVVVDHEQIIIGVERQLGWIKRSLSQTRCLGEFLRVGTANKQGRCPQGDRAAQQAASAQNAVDRIHHVLSVW